LIIAEELSGAGAVCEAEFFADAAEVEAGGGFVEEY
jgi:hypothetical protein